MNTPDNDDNTECKLRGNKREIAVDNKEVASGDIIHNKGYDENMATISRNITTQGQDNNYDSEEAANRGNGGICMSPRSQILK